MKKFVSGVIVGAFLFAGASAFADSNSLIGQKVQGIFNIEKDGVKLAEAVVINGSTYAPVRAISNATGSELTVDGKRIIIQKKEVVSVDSVYDQKKQRDIEGYTKGIENRKEKIKTLESMLLNAHNELESAKTEGDKNAANESISDLTDRLKTEKDYLEDAEAKLAELQQ